MNVQIKIDQAGKTAGIAGFARDDIDTGLPVTLTAIGGPFGQYLWTRLDAPIDNSIPALSSVGIVTPTLAVTNVQPIDNKGTYFFQVAVDSGQGLGATPADIARITFVAGIPTVGWNSTPLRRPAFGEKLEHNAPTALQPTGNIYGWRDILDHWFDVIESNLSRTFGRVHLTSGGATLDQGSNIASVVRQSIGIVKVNFIKPMSTTNYSVIGNARGSNGGSITPNTEALSSCFIERGDFSGSLTDDDFVFFVSGS